MMRKVKKLTVTVPLIMLILGIGSGMQTEAAEKFQPAVVSVEHVVTCETPLCYDSQNLQKMIYTITTYSDGTTKREKVATGECCR